MEDNKAADGKFASGSGDKPKRRTRGPNKPKPAKPVIASIITVETNAVIRQAGIVELLTEYVSAQYGQDVAAAMELQVDTQDGKGWEELNMVVRFATKGSK